ncbi:tyrosine-protein phosphatase non-receptor type 14-like, partial [Symsagittifera roscoffensis]|uniref:tyrosine-protein phosphatase non-receptor type 14-like n=1 Tax=Symsagittifera roscoffensis TaxID=84072 RepID=UPI00307BF0A0
MPFSKLKRTHKYDVSVKNALLVVVELLDQREMECSVANDSSAQECVNIVLNRLQVHAEGFYFGLQYLNKQKHRYRWLELDKSLKKQLDKAGSVSSHVLRFGVMYYIPNISKLQTKQARHLYFLQVRKLITENSFNCSLDAICVLASYSLQAEFGDFNPAVHNVRFLQNYPVFPSKLYGNAPDELFEKVLKLYKERHGLSGDQAELCYMTEAQQIEDYGVEYVEAKMDRTKEDVSIGTSSVGLVLRFRPQSSETGTHSGVDADTVENKQMISWSKIHQMNYKDTSFLVVRLDKSEMKFTVKSNEECRYLWVRSIGNHQIYRQSRKLSLAAASSRS